MAFLFGCEAALTRYNLSGTPSARFIGHLASGRPPEKQGRPAQPGQGRVPDSGHTASSSPASCQYCEACPLGHFARSLLKEASPQSHAGILNITRRQSSVCSAGQVHANLKCAAGCRQGCRSVQAGAESTGLPLSLLTPPSLELMAAAAAAAPVWGFVWAFMAAARFGGRKDGTYLLAFFCPRPEDKNSLSETPTDC